MTFFNRKEEVLDIQLTQHGKRLLAQGTFKPEFYSFFDEDILYDQNHASASIGEEQRFNSDRIIETPRIRTQYNFTDLDIGEKSTFIQNKFAIPSNKRTDRVLGKLSDAAADFNPEVEQDDACCFIDSKVKTIQQKPERHYTNSAPLGTSAPGNQFAPAWQIKFLKAELTGSSYALTGSDKPVQRIPQLDSNVIYRTGVGTEDRPAFELTEAEEFAASEDIEGEAENILDFFDGTNIQVKKDFILLELAEVNGFTLNKNFDIEVYRVDEAIVAGKTKETLVPLRFSQFDQSQEYTVSENNFVTKQVNLQLEEDIDELEAVSYYLNISSDKEISEEILCSLSPPEKTKGIFSKRTFDCAGIEADSREDIYGSETEYEDPCEE